MEITTLLTAHADVLELVPGMRRTGARAVSYEANDFEAVYRALMTAIYLGATV
jgi:D-aminopeptidase